MFFTHGSAIGKNYDIDTNTQRVVAFNSQFDKYVGVTERNADGSFKEKGNIPSDVITCANLAYNINRKNEFDSVNKVEVFVVNSENQIIYSVLANKSQPNNAFSNGDSFNDFLQKYNQMKIVTLGETVYRFSGETVYKYYFDVNQNGIHYSDVTGKVDKIVFTLVEITDFEEL